MYTKYGHSDHFCLGSKIVEGVGDEEGGGGEAEEDDRAVPQASPPGAWPHIQAPGVSDHPLDGILPDPRMALLYILRVISPPTALGERGGGGAEAFLCDPKTCGNTGG